MKNVIPSVLYLEDDPVQRRLLVVILEKSRFQVKMASCAVRAIEFAATEDFDVAVLDYDLPDMSGSQVARRIRAFNKSTRIVLLSGRASCSFRGIE